MVHAVLLDGSLALNHGGTDGHALKVLVVEEAVVVNVCERERARFIWVSLDYN